MLKRVAVLLIRNSKLLKSVWCWSPVLEERFERVWWERERIRGGAEGRGWRVRRRCCIGCRCWEKWRFRRVMMRKTVQRVAWNLNRAWCGCGRWLWKQRWRVRVRVIRRVGIYCVMLKLWYFLNSTAEMMRRGWLHDVTDSHYACVDFKGINILQEEALETRWDKIKSVRVFVCRLEISDELKSLEVKSQRSKMKDGKSI